MSVFLEACKGGATDYVTKEGAEEYCACTAGKIMRLYPNAADVGALTDEEINLAAEECIMEMIQENKDVFLPWNDETKKAFFDGCQEELVGSGIDGNVYCSCALEEILKRCATPFQAARLSEDVFFQIALECLGE